MNKLHSLWLKLRKRTVVAHWLFGKLCAVVAVLFFPAGFGLLIMFGVFEWWNDQNLRIRVGDSYKPEGDEDWWDSFLAFCIGFSGAVILDIIGIISIRWL